MNRKKGKISRNQKHLKEVKTVGCLLMVLLCMWKFMGELEKRGFLSMVHAATDYGGFDVDINIGENWETPQEWENQIWDIPTQEETIQESETNIQPFPENVSQPAVTIPDVITQNEQFQEENGSNFMIENPTGFNEYPEMQQPAVTPEMQGEEMLLGSGIPEETQVPENQDAELLPPPTVTPIISTEASPSPSTAPDLETKITPIPTTALKNTVTVSLEERHSSNILEKGGTVNFSHADKIAAQEKPCIQIKSKGSVQILSFRINQIEHQWSWRGDILEATEEIKIKKGKNEVELLVISQDGQLCTMEPWIFYA